MRYLIENFFALFSGHTAISSVLVPSAGPSFGRSSLNIRTVPLGNITGKNGGKGADITWTEIIDFPVARPLEYLNEQDEYSSQIVSTAKRGFCASGIVHIGLHDGDLLHTFPADRLLTKLPTLTGKGYHAMNMRQLMRLKLPRWKNSIKVVKIPNASGKRRWTVNLDSYTCTCPERIRRSSRFEQGQLGMACPHVVMAIRENLEDFSPWPKEIIGYLNRHDAGSRSHCVSM
jgi:hypothetical protein